MPVVVSEKFDSFVKDAVASGRYRSETEVVEDALRLLRARCEKLDRLRADVEVGLADLNAGRVTLVSDGSAIPEVPNTNTEQGGRLSC